MILRYGRYGKEPCPRDFTDEEWAFAAPYLTMMPEEAPQRQHDIHEVFNALRWNVRTCSAWRYMPNGPARFGVRVPAEPAWLARFRRLARDYERLPRTLAGLHFVAFACLALSRLMQGISCS
jgi:transposase